ncbi:gefF, partial [Symbiodinium sp. KB8]
MGYYNDLHLYDPEAGSLKQTAGTADASEANSWSQLSPSGSAPSARFGHTAVESPSAGGMLVFGGLDASLDANGDQRTYLNDLHLYDPQAGSLKQTAGTADMSEANSWSQLSPSGSAPSVRRYHTAVESPGAGGMLVFGG